MSKLMIVVGGQFGSEAKGAAAGYLASKHHQPLVIRTGGPNAGHTVVDPVSGVTHKLRMLPTAAVTNPTAQLALCAGSVVDPDLLEKECIEVGAFVNVDRAATILGPDHREAESLDPDMQWGSTQSGTGSARMQRIHRTAETWGWRSGAHTLHTDVARMARNHLQEPNGAVLIEGAQGYGLGLHTEFYPKTTSSDCRAIDLLADVGISPWEFPTLKLEVWVVIRPYPIRVAGDSGPLYQETSWEALGLPEERTTVTNKVRRVGMWDDGLLVDALRANGRRDPVVRVWFSMADQVVPSVAGKTDSDQLTAEEFRALEAWANRVRDCGGRVAAFGTGPATAMMWPDWAGRNA